MATMEEEVNRLKYLRARIATELLTPIMKEAMEAVVVYVEGHTPSSEFEMERATHQFKLPHGQWGDTTLDISEGSGAMRNAWRRDSHLEPVVIETGVEATLGNAVKSDHDDNDSYASYVNDGHKMDEHYVRKLGLVVGTKTLYIPGIHMVEGANVVFEDFFADKAKDRVSEFMSGG